MKIRSAFLLFVLQFTFLFCNKKIEKKEIQERRVEKIEVLDTLQGSKTENTSFDSNTTIAEGIIYRSGADDNWKSVFATNIFGFKKAPKIGEKVQIIPLRNELATLELAIENVTKRNDVEEGNHEYDWYEIELEKIKNKSYWRIKSPEGIRSEYPSDILVVYPPIKNASLLDIKSLNDSDLPEKVNLNVIKGALDFDGNGKPDALVLSFCCKNKSSNENCEYKCGETYIKLNNQWKLMNSSQPL